MVGGFHLTGVSDAVVEQTINALKEAGPRYIVPTHCTGYNSVRKMQDAMPEVFIPNSVGSKLKF